LSEAVLKGLLEEGQLSKERLEYLEENIHCCQLRLLSFSTLGQYDKALDTYQNLT